MMHFFGTTTILRYVGSISQLIIPQIHPNFYFLISVQKYTDVCLF
jgi:hypothetical protein